MVIILLGVMAYILMIGKERKPVTPVDAVVQLTINGFFFVVFLQIWQQL